MGARRRRPPAFYAHLLEAEATPLPAHVAPVVQYLETHGTQAPEFLTLTQQSQPPTAEALTFRVEDLSDDGVQGELRPSLAVTTTSDPAPPAAPMAFSASASTDDRGVAANVHVSVYVRVC